MLFILAPVLGWSDDDLHPDQFAFPASTLAEDVLVEGVVVRSDDAGRRVKLVREEFREMNRE